MVGVKGHLTPISAPPHRCTQEVRINAHTEASVHIRVKTRTDAHSKEKEIPGRCSGADPETVPLQQPCSQHSDDLLLELVNTGHPEREREVGGG